MERKNKWYNERMETLGRKFLSRESKGLSRQCSRFLNTALPEKAEKNNPGRVSDSKAQSTRQEIPEPAGKDRSGSFILKFYNNLLFILSLTKRNGVPSPCSWFPKVNTYRLQFIVGYSTQWAIVNRVWSQSSTTLGAHVGMANSITV